MIRVINLIQQIGSNKMPNNLKEAVKNRNWKQVAELERRSQEEQLDRGLQTKLNSWKMRAEPLLKEINTEDFSQAPEEVETEMYEISTTLEEVMNFFHRLDNWLR